MLCYRMSLWLLTWARFLPSYLNNASSTLSRYRKHVKYVFLLFLRLVYMKLCLSSRLRNTNYDPSDGIISLMNAKWCMLCGYTLYPVLQTRILYAQIHRRCRSCMECPCIGLSTIESEQRPKLNSMVPNEYFRRVQFKPSKYHNL